MLKQELTSLSAFFEDWGGENKKKAERIFLNICIDIVVFTTCKKKQNIFVRLFFGEGETLKIDKCKAISLNLSLRDYLILKKSVLILANVF